MKYPKYYNIMMIIVHLCLPAGKLEVIFMIYIVNHLNFREQIRRRVSTST
jgi:hypothetical protein